MPLIITSQVAERSKIERRTELPVDPTQDVPVKRGSDAGWIVIGLEQGVARLDEIEADQDVVARSKMGSKLPEERLPLVCIEVSDAASQEEQQERCVV